MSKGGKFMSDIVSYNKEDVYATQNLAVPHINTEILRGISEIREKTDMCDDLWYRATLAKRLIFLKRNLL